MAKKSMIARDVKRKKMVSRFAAKRAALKAAAALTTTVLSLTLHSREGAGHQVVAQCQPTMDAKGQISGCTMRITFDRDSSGCSGNADAAVMIPFADCGRLPGDKELRRRCLTEHRFRTGLAIQQALNRREALSRRAGGCA